MRMGKYPPWELVANLISVKISLAERQRKPEMRILIHSYM